MFGAVGLLVDGQRPAHQRLGLRQPVRGLEQLRQVVEARGDVRVFGAVGLLVDGQRRRISGSASASRFVAWSNCARLLRSLATWVFGAVGLLVDGQRGASAARPPPAGSWPGATTPGC